jgi:hypothetical protein
MVRSLLPAVRGEW